MTDHSARLMPGVPPAARWLGLAGLIPFAGLAVLCVLTSEVWAVAALVNYGAIILSFMGGCRWGFAAAGMGEGPTLVPLAVSVIPALGAWVLMAAAPGLAMTGLAAGFVALLLADLKLSRTGGAPVWWGALRRPLSLGAAASLLIGALAAG